MNANPTSAKINDKTVNDISLVQPVGKTIYIENTFYKKNPRLGIVERKHIEINIAERAKNSKDT